MLTLEDSFGFWYKITYDEDGNIAVLESSLWQVRPYIAHDGLFALYFEAGRYKAGCRDFSY